MKKRIVLFVFSVLITSSLFFNLAEATDINDIAQGIEDTADTVEDTAESIGDVAENLRDENYLANAWKNLIQNNPIIKGIDFLFIKLNIVFKVLFAQDYGLFTDIWFVMVLWLLVALILMDLIQAQFETLSGVGLIIGILFATGLAWVKVYALISSLVLGIVNWFSWWPLRFVMWIVVLFVIVWIFMFFTSIGKSIRKSKREKEDKQTRKRQKRLEKFMDSAGI